MNHDIAEMARRHYGFGRWEAPYWFIGPEQGQSSSETTLNPRVEAWLHLGGDELTDCRDFHARLGGTRWHRERPPLQRTWRRLMMLLMSYLDKPHDIESLRNYQRDRWGRRNGETCVIELSGLPAHNKKVSRDRERFREARIETIRRRMRDHQPELVVMYGKEPWSALAGQEIPDDRILTLGSMTLAVTPHPNKRGLTDAYWKHLGQTLRRINASG